MSGEQPERAAFDDHYWKLYRQERVNLVRTLQPKAKRPFQVALTPQQITHVARSASKVNQCACGCGEECKAQYVRGHQARVYWKDRPRVPQPVRGKRKVFSHDQKMAALQLIRSVGVREASRRLVGISAATLGDWKAQAKAFAYSELVTQGRRHVTDAEREMVLAQLIQEQELESRLISRRKHRHQNETAGGMSAFDDLGVVLTHSGVVARHLLGWLDPTFDEVADRMAA